MDERTPDDPKYREQMARVMASELPEKWEREPMDDLAPLTEWLERLTGKTVYVRRRGDQIIAVIEGATLAALTVEEARERWEHVLALYGWVKEGGECP